MLGVFLWIYEMAKIELDQQQIVELVKALGNCSTDFVTLEVDDGKRIAVYELRTEFFHKTVEGAK
jgi:hypothetical protein